MNFVDIETFKFSSAEYLPRDHSVRNEHDSFWYKDVTMRQDIKRIFGQSKVGDDNFIICMKHSENSILGTLK